jgi:hypothetical protein
VSVDSTIVFISGFIRPNSEIRKMFSFITHVQKPHTKFYSVIWIVLIHCVEQALCLCCPLLMLQNSVNAGFRDTNLMGEQCLTDFFGDSVKACNTVATFSLLAEL